MREEGCDQNGFLKKTMLGAFLQKTHSDILLQLIASLSTVNLQQSCAHAWYTYISVLMILIYLDHNCDIMYKCKVVYMV